MNSLQAYILPLKGIGDGTHQFSFTVEDDFFQSFEASPVEKGIVEVNVGLDKRPTLMVFEFSFSGRLVTSCDRCLANIQLPIKGENRLLVKYGEGEEENMDEDVIFIPQETSSWSIAQFIYEYILLALPLIKVYDCREEEEPPCDMKMLAKLEMVEYQEPENKEEEENNNPFRDAFKDWNKQSE